MAKIQDRLYNRNIVGKLLELSNEEKSKLALGSKYVVEDIKDIPQDILLKLKVGDTVVERYEDSNHNVTEYSYFVASYSKDTGDEPPTIDLMLFSYDNQEITEVYYTNYTYSDTYTFSIPTLYQHDLTFMDNQQNELQVYAISTNNEPITDDTKWQEFINSVISIINQPHNSLFSVFSIFSSTDDKVYAVCHSTSLGNIEVHEMVSIVQDNVDTL